MLLSSKGRRWLSRLGRSNSSPSQTCRQRIAQQIQCMREMKLPGKRLSRSTRKAPRSTRRKQMNSTKNSSSRNKKRYRIRRVNPSSETRSRARELIKATGRKARSTASETRHKCISSSAPHEILRTNSTSFNKFSNKITNLLRSMAQSTRYPPSMPCSQKLPHSRNTESSS